MKRHLRWLAPLVATPFIFFGCIRAINLISSLPNYDASLGLGLLNLALLALALLGPLASIIVCLIGAARVWRAWRRRAGHLTPVEQAHLVRQTRIQDSRNAALRLRSQLLAREVPPAITVWGLVPLPGEVMFFEVEADYARYYGKTVTYTANRSRVYGPPAFVAAGLIAKGIGNTSRQLSAEAEARTQWREREHSRVVITNQRLACFAGGRWLSFHYSGITALYPDVSTSSVVCEFGDTVPLMLVGPDAPLISVMAVMMTHGVDALSTHPGLAGLVPAS